MANENPSLYMCWQKQRLKTYPLLEGFKIRPIKDGEEIDWCESMLNDMGVNEASYEQFYNKMLIDNTVKKENILVVADELDVLIGTATAQIREGDIPFLHMVSIKPSMRGKKLAKPLVAAVLQRHLDLGFDICYLYTQEFRKAAVKMYIDLGFLPIMSHESYKKKYEQLAFDLSLPFIKALDADKKPSDDILPIDHGLVFIDD